MQDLRKQPQSVASLAFSLAFFGVKKKAFFGRRGICKEDKDWIFGDRTHPASGCKSKREGNNGHALPFARDKTPKAPWPWP